MAAEGALRLDKWLWIARFVKTRSLAAKLATERRVRLNGQVVAKAAQSVKPGDVLTFVVGQRVRVIRVLAFAPRRGPPAEARLLYDDLSPPAPPREAHVPDLGGAVDPEAEGFQEDDGDAGDDATDTGAD